jgi:hypothetical protein
VRKLGKFSCEKSSVLRYFLEFVPKITEFPLELLQTHVPFFISVEACNKSFLLAQQVSGYSNQILHFLDIVLKELPLSGMITLCLNWEFIKFYCTILLLFLLIHTLQSDAESKFE